MLKGIGMATMRKTLPLAVLALVIIGGLVWWHFAASGPDNQLYGNVEIREVNLAFNAEGRVGQMLRQEGEHVQLVLDARRSNTALLVANYAAEITAAYDTRLQTTLAQPVDIEIANLLNPALNGKCFILPGLVAANIVLAAALLFFQLPLDDNLFVLEAGLALFALVAVVVGLGISAVTKTQ